MGQGVAYVRGRRGACAPPTHLRADAANYVWEGVAYVWGTGERVPHPITSERIQRTTWGKVSRTYGGGGASAPPTHLRADTAMSLLHAGLMTGISGA